MAKHFVTTMNKRLFDDYGKDLLISYMNTSQKYPIYVYVEDDIQKYPIMKMLSMCLYLKKNLNVKNL